VIDAQRVGNTGLTKGQSLRGRAAAAEQQSIDRAAAGEQRVADRMMAHASRCDRRWYPARPGGWHAA
jgi:hypothetical protein